jgi:hypothetical protein
MMEVIMSTEKEPFKPEKSDKQPTEKKTGELTEEQLDKVGGGTGGGIAPHGPAGPGG